MYNLRLRKFTNLAKIDFMVSRQLKTQICSAINGFQSRTLNSYYFTFTHLEGIASSHDRALGRPA